MREYHMRLSLILLFCFFSVQMAVGQSKDSTVGETGIAPYDVPDVPNFPKSDTFSKVDVQAKYVGGENSFTQFIRDNFRYPNRCMEEGISGYVMLKFVVDTRGNISQISAIEQTASCPEFTEEAIRVIKSSPKWIPAQINGRFVNSWRTIPIQLSLD